MNLTRIISNKYSSWMRSLRFTFFICILSCCLFPAKAQVTSAAAASFSLRKINPAYTGNAIQIRRSSDNATLNVGFTSCGFLDTVSLKTFIGANSAFVITWYDQSGNGRNATQATAASQPRIMNAGAMDNANNRPAIVWPGASSSGIYLAYGTNMNIRTVNAIRDFKLNPFTSSANNMQYLFSSPANSDYAVRLSSSGTFSYDGDNNGNDWITGSGTPKLCWVNGTRTTAPQYALHAVTATGPNVINGSFSIGTTFMNRNLFGNDAVSELVVFSGTLSNTQRTLIETNEAVNYTLTVSNSKYTPPSLFSYNLFVNGVGRESATDSVAGTPRSSGMGFKIGNGAADFLKDNGDYLTAGMNCPITPTTSTSNLPGTIFQRWANDWYINKTDVGNNNGTISFYFDFTDYGAGNTPGAAANYELLGRNSTAATFSIVPGTTRSVSGSRVLFSVDASNIGTTGYYTIGTRSVSASPLPIELTRFECQVSDRNTVLLNWSTSSELNNDHFLVERTLDAVHYEPVGTLKGAGTTQLENNYRLEDKEPLSSLAYYRLTQFDTDGRSKSFNLCYTELPGASDFSIFPNPAKEYVEITNKNSKYPGTISVIHASGKLMYQANFPEKTIKLSTAEFEDGVYFVKLESGNSVSVRKLLIQH